jgi:hypothetical protein
VMLKDVLEPAEATSWSRLRSGIRLEPRDNTFGDVLDHNRVIESDDLAAVDLRGVDVRDLDSCRTPLARLAHAAMLRRFIPPPLAARAAFQSKSGSP